MKYDCMAHTRSLITMVLAYCLLQNSAQAMDGKIMRCTPPEDATITHIQEARCRRCFLFCLSGSNVVARDRLPTLLDQMLDTNKDLVFPDVRTERATAYGFDDEGYTDMLRRFLAVQPCLLEIADDVSGMTPLMYAACSGHQGAVRYLIAQGANLFAFCKKNRTARDCAVSLRTLLSPIKDKDMIVRTDAIIDNLDATMRDALAR